LPTFCSENYFWSKILAAQFIIFESKYMIPGQKATNINTTTVAILKRLQKKIESIKIKNHT